MHLITNVGGDAGCRETGLKLKVTSYLHMSFIISERDDGGRFFLISLQTFAVTCKSTTTVRMRIDSSAFSFGFYYNIILKPNS